MCLEISSNLSGSLGYKLNTFSLLKRKSSELCTPKAFLQCTSSVLKAGPSITQKQQQEVEVSNVKINRWEQQTNKNLYMYILVMQLKK